MAKKHIATYPLYGYHTGNRVGTGYVYDQKTMEKARRHCEVNGYGLKIRWRNEECRREYEAQCAEQS